MKAAQVRAGAGEVAIEEVERREPGPGQVRVAVEAAAVNPVDVMVSSGVFWDPSWTVVGNGWDFAGRVDAVGDGVDDLKEGDLVAGIDTDLPSATRAQAEYVVADRPAVAAIPAGLTVQQTASVPLNALTAMQALTLLGEPSGRRLLITGAAGAVGGYALALAADAGWKVIGLARAGDEEFVRATGADEFVTSLDGAAYDAVLDAAALQEKALAAVSNGGDFVGVLPASVPATERGIETQAVQVAADQSQLKRALELSASGRLQPRIAGTFPLSEAGTAYDKVAAGGNRGRWLLLP
ncbi:zinc-binding dehydrogenase [Epidermidibacterium keratini]|uniref:Zinc-binding dehydrogenase n=1 Tax=Epidermidibacterium keratini TaxID=1891644 RepID=A0A7L4YPD6_9ACTN|nr:zinc-binding dehydrogenase [Epidermidibacterium keratini]QHC00892.1 zinc-binding dehydrogenase [Epidermidibacterium keratini]